MVPGFLSPVIQRPDGQVYHKPPRSAEGENEWSHTSTSHICLRSGRQHTSFSSSVQSKKQAGHVDVYVIHKSQCRPTLFSSLHVDCCRRHNWRSELAAVTKLVALQQEVGLRQNLLVCCQWHTANRLHMQLNAAHFIHKRTEIIDTQTALGPADVTQSSR